MVAVLCGCSSGPYGKPRVPCTPSPPHSNLIDALFIVDAVVPELRAQGLGGTANISADLLLRYQLETLAGQNKELLTPLGAVRFFLSPPCEPKFTSQQADVVTGAVDCSGPIISFTMRRAFPGLASSVWFVAEAHK